MMLRRPWLDGEPSFGCSLTRSMSPTLSGISQQKSYHEIDSKQAVAAMRVNLGAGILLRLGLN